MDEPVAKGLYILSALDLIASSSSAEVASAIRVEAGLPERVSSLRDYPQRQLSRVVKLGKERCFASLDDNEVVRRFGAAAFEAFASTIVGKVGVALARAAKPDQVARALARMHNASTKASTVEAIDIRENGFRLRYRGAVHAWYQLGLNEAGFAKHAPVPAKVTLDVKRHVVDDNWMPSSECEFDVVVDAI
jgi:uncharacterized protein (TIGR02265 family)